MLGELVQAHDATASTISLSQTSIAALIAAIVTAPSLAALGVTRWLMRQAERQRTDEKVARKERDEMIRTSNDELRNVSANNARTAEILAQLATNLVVVTGNVAQLDKRVANVEHSLDEGVSASLAAHAETRAAVERVEAQLQRRSPRTTSGRAEAPALFLLAATSSMGVGVGERLVPTRAAETRPEEFVATPRFAAALARLALAEPHQLVRHE